jgi:histone-lysine N-methyltransferase SETMAR
LAKNSIEELPHPPYSPDLAQCHFRLFPKLKNDLVAKSSQSDPQLKGRVNRFLNGFLESDWSAIFQELLRRWEQCFNEEGIYFE